MSSTTAILAEENVTLENLANLMKKAFLKATIDEDGDLMVEIGKITLFVRLNEKNKLIRFITYFRFKDDAPKEGKYTFVNDVNDEVIFTRFAISLKSEDRFYADYSLPYENGVLEFQIIAALRLFEETTIGAIRAIDTFDVVR